MPSAAGFQEKASSRVAARPGHDEHAGRGDQDGEPLAGRHLVAQERQAEHGDLHRLGLGLGGGDDERALLHGGEQQSGGGDLGQRGTAVQAIIAAFSGGHRLPRSPPAPGARNSSANGSPNRKRTCVAPTVPRTAVSSFCMALRSTWPPAAATVKTAHSQGMSAAPPCRRDGPGCRQIRPSGQPRNSGPGMSDLGACRRPRPQPSSCQRPSARRQAMPSALCRRGADAS